MHIFNYIFLYICRRMPTLSYEQLHKQLLDSYETINYSGFDEENNILFNKIWGSNILTQEEEVQLKNLLEDEHLPFVTGCQIVSAFLLSLLDSFDKGKMKLLFIAASHKNYEIKARALINLLIILYLYKNRKAYYPQLTNLLAALNEEPGFTHTLQTITLRFILARETEKITRKLQEEIIPEMIKLTPNLGKNINMKDMARAFLVKSPNVYIAGNCIVHSTHTAIKLGGELSWHEAGPTHNVVIENNYISGCGYAVAPEEASCIYTSTESPETPPCVNHDIIIRNNTFDTDKPNAIVLKDSEHGNRCGHLFLLINADGSIWLTLMCQGIEQESFNNSFLCKYACG